MLNHTYTSVKNANLVDCGKKQHISSQPQHLVRDNFLGEYRTELDKKKVLANLGIATELSLEWENIKGDIGRSESLINELNSRTKYISIIDGFTKNVTDGIKYLESVVYTDLEKENEQNNRLTSLETTSSALISSLKELQDYLLNTVTIDLNKLTNDLQLISDKVLNITELILVSTKKDNALIFILDDGLYVPDLSKTIEETSKNVGIIQENLKTVQNALDDFVTKEDLGGDTFDFVNQSDFENYTQQNQNKFNQIEADLLNTVKTGLDGHVDTLFVNTISKETKGNISITDSFEVSTNIPLDIRAVVSNIDELHSLNPEVCYPGMGVVVADLASLYILREPVNEIIDADYIKDANGVNWKCPEDLIIEVISLLDYDKKLNDGSINPNMFYYIHEEVIEEPVRDLYQDDASYEEALHKWLRVLQLEYMSAVWGQEIEKLVASKASNTAIESLKFQILELLNKLNILSGGASDVDLKSLKNSVELNSLLLDNLIREDGIIADIQNELQSVLTDINVNYVTKLDITTEDPDIEYIFVKKSNFNEYTQKHEQSLSEQVTSQVINTNKIVLSENIIQAKDSALLLNNEELALNKHVPVIEILSREDFEATPDDNKDPNTYYYICDDDERYILNSEFSRYKENQSNNQITLSNLIIAAKENIGDLTKLTTNNTNTLVFAINEVKADLANLTSTIGDPTQLPENTSDIVSNINNIYLKINELSDKLDTLTDRVNSLETV